MWKLTVVKNCREEKRNTHTQHNRRNRKRMFYTPITLFPLPFAKRKRRINKRTINYLHRFTLPGGTYGIWFTSWWKMGEKNAYSEGNKNKSDNGFTGKDRGRIFSSSMEEGVWNFSGDENQTYILQIEVKGETEYQYT